MASNVICYLIPPNNYLRFSQIIPVTNKNPTWVFIRHDGLIIYDNNRHFLTKKGKGHAPGQSDIEGQIMPSLVRKCTLFVPYFKINYISN